MSAPPTILPIVASVSSLKLLAICTPTSDSGAEPTQHPEREPRVDGAEHPVSRGPERLEDCTVEDVRPDRDLRVEAEDRIRIGVISDPPPMPGQPDEHPDEQSREGELPGHAEGRPGIGHETNGRPVKRQPSLYASQPVQNPVAAASSASAATSSASAVPATLRSCRVGERRRRRARRRRRCSPPAAAGCPRAAPRRTAAAPARSRRGTAGRSAARRRDPTASWSASTPTSQCQPAATATSERTPIVAWLNRGARESITAVSRYGSASPCIRALCPVCVDQHLCDLGTRELDRRQLARGQHLAHLRPAQEDVILRRVRARLRARHRPARLAPERVLEEHRLDVELVRLELVEDQLRVVRAVVVADARRDRGRR